jgi:hypothetical protein
MVKDSAAHCNAVFFPPSVVASILVYTVQQDAEI